MAVEEVLRALYLVNFGSSVWEEMKSETEDAFGSDENIYGGTAVVNELCKLVEQKPDTPLFLIGHSTGGVYIGNFVSHADEALKASGDTTTKFNIILMAPANTADFFSSMYGDRIAGIRIIPNDRPNGATGSSHVAQRRPDDRSILGKIYPRSLLYLVSGVCEYFEGQVTLALTLLVAVTCRFLAWTDSRHVTRSLREVTIPACPRSGRSFRSRRCSVSSSGFFRQRPMVQLLGFRRKH